MSTGIDIDRRTESRFVRNLTLTLSGGAILTVLGAGAGVAHAEDGAAGSSSDGAGAAQSGDATAIGNRSGTQKNQTGSASGAVGGLQVLDQTAAVANVGVAVADTGHNRAVGNESQNTATAQQGALDALGGATNSGTAANASTGTARISTGHASAIGNQSSTAIDQSANGTAHGGLGGILVVSQTGAVANAGVALAQTGDNEATGNTSVNVAGLIQNANASAGLASNSGKSQNSSDGLATIATGSASAVGNLSDSKVLQSTQGSAGGDDPGGLELLLQVGLVVNAGEATANSGTNLAVGNSSSENRTDVTQNIGTAAPTDGPTGVASNSAEASSWSDGSAAIWTGPTDAVGNQSVTDVSQTSDSSVDGLAASIAPQAALVLDAGVAYADSGNNRAFGNNSSSTATVTQTVPPTDGTDLGVAGNFGQAQNTSDGSATIQTGAAAAGGNRSRTTVWQELEAKSADLDVLPQLGVVVNAGDGQAVSGRNQVDGTFASSRARLDQNAALSTEDPSIDVGVVGQFGKASNTNRGSAGIYTGNAVAQGNDAETDLHQAIDPSGLVLTPQLAIVANVGTATALTGDNEASGNGSTNSAAIGEFVPQEALIGQLNDATEVIAGTIVASNNGEASTASDGSAEIVTGPADATGNVSRTALRQTADGGIDGMGLVLQPQVGVVANVGQAVATTGVNRAVGNESNNNGSLGQQAQIASDNTFGGPQSNLTTFFAAPLVVASNQGAVSTSSDGSATIRTGRASAAGNRSETALTQDADGRVDGLGVVLNTQVGVVVNAGVAQANTGDNDAIGNTSSNFAGAGQTALVASDNSGGSVSMTVIGPVTAANSADVEAVSAGDATVRTGAAMSVGNASATQLDQTADGHAPGLVLDTQIGVVANIGLAQANTGQNFATGNGSGEDCRPGGDDVDAAAPASCNDAFVSQTATILSENPFLLENLGTGTFDMLVVGPTTASNTASASDPTDGTARITTGDAQAQGNVSSTFLVQETDGDVPGLGGVIGTQAAGVANVGLAQANTGRNTADGNVSTNRASADQIARIGSANPVSVDMDVIGPATASNVAEAGSTADGTATVGTGSALATGNASATNVSQRQTGTVHGLGLAVGTQAGLVVNAGEGIANTGDNQATGNESENLANPEGFRQDAWINSVNPDPAETTIVGPATASNTASVTNTSDGDACICTGNAVASGNVASTTLIQDADLTATSGFIVLTEAGAVLNAGRGLANTGENTARGNSSANEANAEQLSQINDALLEPVDGPQTAANTVGLANTSRGSGHVGTGNASGTGNQSTTDFVQAATVDGGFAFSTLAGATVNAGLGDANTGHNDATGNDSTNQADLHQTADGSGLVANQGTVTNDSDGTAIIGDPQCCDDEDVPGPGKKEQGLPRTGADLEAEAVAGLLLLLSGFALRRRSKQLV